MRREMSVTTGFIRPAVRTAIVQVAGIVIGGSAKRATKFISHDLIVKATYRFKFDKRSRSHNIVLTVGHPNYAERKFIAGRVKEGVPFPVRKIQLKLYPTKRKRAA